MGFHPDWIERQLAHDERTALKVPELQPAETLWSWSLNEAKRGIRYLPMPPGVFA
jgi:hypothetical protein